MVIWRRTIQIAREKTRCCHMGCSFQLTARVLLYAPSHRYDSTYHDLCYTSHGALARTRNSSVGPPHEGSIQPIAPWVNTLTMDLHLAPISRLWVCSLLVVSEREDGVVALNLHSNLLSLKNSFYVCTGIWTNAITTKLESHTNYNKADIHTCHVPSLLIWLHSTYQ